MLMKAELQCRKRCVMCMQSGTQCDMLTPCYPGSHLSLMRSTLPSIIQSAGLQRCVPSPRRWARAATSGPEYKPLHAIRVTGDVDNAMQDTVCNAYAMWDTVCNAYAMWDAMRYAYTVLPGVSCVPDRAIVRLVSGASNSNIQDCC